MGELDWGEKLKFELAALGLSTDEHLEMVGKCNIAIKVFGDPAKDPSGSVTFGFPSDRKRFHYPRTPSEAALDIYDYLYRYKRIELAKQPVGKPPSERTHTTFNGWMDRVTGGKKHNKNGELRGCLRHGNHADRYCSDCWSVIHTGMTPEEVDERNKNREHAKGKKKFSTVLEGFGFMSVESTEKRRVYANKADYVVIALPSAKWTHIDVKKGGLMSDGNGLVPVDGATIVATGEGATTLETHLTSVQVGGVAKEPPKRVFAMPPSEVMSDAKSVEHLLMSDLADTKWVVNSSGSPVLTDKLAVSDLSSEMVAKMRGLSRRLRDLESKVL